MANSGSVNTIASKFNFDNGRTAADNYITACRQLVTDIDNTIENLTADNAGFNGEAADGFKEFYTKVKPALTTQLTDGSESLMAGIKSMLDAIEKALRQEMDPSLGNENRSAAPTVSQG